MPELRCPECGAEKISVENQAECAGCGRAYPVMFGEVPDFAPVEGFRDTAAHSYTYSYSSRFYETFRKSFFMEITTGVSWREEKRRLFERMQLEKDIAILEVGCGTGIFTRRFALMEPSADVWGLDYSYSQLRQAVRLKRKEGAANLRFAHGLAAKLPFADAGFDRVCTVGSMQFFGDLETFLREARRVLKPGGTFTAINYLSPDYKRGETALMRQVQKAALSRGGHLFSKGDVVDAAQRAGFVGADFFEKGITFFLTARK